MTSASSPTSSAPSSALPTPGTSTPASNASSINGDASATPSSEEGATNSSVDPLPTFSSLDLSLSRDQGTHHKGFGAGSEALTMSATAHSNHGVLAPRILTSGSIGKAGAGGALSPENLPQAPKELPLPLPTIDSSRESSMLSTPEPRSTPELTAPSSTLATPGETRPTTPALAPVAAQAQPAASTAAMAPPPPPSATAPTPAVQHFKPPLKEKKSVFGKLFERGNASSQSLLGGEKMERGESGNTSASASASGSGVGGAAANGGGAALARKTSKKEKEREQKEIKEREKEAEKEEKRARKEQKEREKEESRLLRAPSEDRGSKDRSSSAGGSRPRAGSHGEKQAKEGGMGQALNDFMRHKVQRKSSQTSKKSDDGRSERGGSEAGSAYGGSTKGRDDDTRSRGGASNASLSKKYGVCEKVVIGKGATAVVKLAHKWDRSTERLYAVKEFRKRRKNETEKEYVKKLTSEFCISSTLHHHNIVETVDLVQDEQNHWCEVMEYCPGGDLYAAIKKGDMAAPEINSYFKQILAGVSYLHSMGVAHRDIKPENLLLDAKGHVKITDFGVSDVFRMCWEKTTHLSKGLCGSEPYIAPEQFEQKEYDARLVDVWACAVVFYCMHFQELPWRVAKPSDPSFGPYLQLYSSSSSPPPLSNLVPRECRNIIKRMLDPDPRTRATTEMILKDPWFESIKVIPALEGILPVPPTVGLPSAAPLP